MLDPDPRPSLLPGPLLRVAKVLIGTVAVVLAVVGGLLTFGVAFFDVGNAWLVLIDQGGFSADPEKSHGAASEMAIVFVVKSIDAILLGLVQFLLAAFLWQILDPKESLLNEENMQRLEEAKQILCKVVLVIVAVRMLGAVLQPDALRWEHLIMPAGIGALAFATRSLQNNNAARGAAARRPDVA